MDKVKMYYRFEAIGIDVTDEREVRKYNEELTSFACLERQLNMLETAYNDKLKERADIFVNALPSVSGLYELSVFHNIKFKLFSKTVKSQNFSLCATYYDESGKSYLYYCTSQDIKEVRRIFEDFVNEYRIPDFSQWDCTYIG